MHAGLIIFVDRVGSESMFTCKHAVSDLLLFHLHLVCLHRKDACVISVKVSEQASPVAPEVVLDSIVVLFEISI